MAYLPLVRGNSPLPPSLHHAPPKNDPHSGPCLVPTLPKHGPREVTLFGVSGDNQGSSDGEKLFTIDMTDASTTLFMSLGNGNDGESIAYNPLDGFMYHWSGLGDPNVDEVMERIDLTAKSVTNVPLSGFDYDEIFAATFDAATGGFLATDYERNFLRISSSGSVTQLGNQPFAMKGLAFSGSTLFALEQFDQYDEDDELDLLTLDPNDGAVLDSINVTLDGVNLNGSSNGLAINPETGQLYGVIQGGGRRLVTIDPLTGIATQIGVLDSNRPIAGIAFVNSVPEPSSTALLTAIALGGLLFRCRRRLIRGRKVESTDSVAR